MDLVLFACLVATPASCKDERIQISVAYVAPSVCFAIAPPLVAEWTVDHPDWSVAGWRCEGLHDDRRARR